MVGVLATGTESPGSKWLLCGIFKKLPLFIQQGAGNWQFSEVGKITGLRKWHPTSVISI